MEEKGTMHVHLLTELTGNLYSEESEWEEEWSESDEYGMPLDGTELADYEEVIREELERYGEDDLMQYFDGSESIQEKIQSAVVTIENKDGILYGCTKLELNEFLSQEELQEFTEYITGQYSDGWGEGFEQRDIKVDGGTMNVHFWHPNMEQPKMYEKKTEQIPTKPEKQRPKLQLLGHDGNIFSIMGDASTLLKKNKQTAEAKEMCKRVLESGDYYKALLIISEYVETELSPPPKENKKTKKKKKSAGTLRKERMMPMTNGLSLEELMKEGTYPEEYAEGENWRILHGDTLKLVKAFQPGIFDAVITDPPYASGGTKQNERNRTTNQKYSSMSAANALPDFDGDNKDQRSWTHWMAEWLYDVRKACKKGAPICLFIDWRQYPSITDALQWAGWIWRGTAVWDKGNSRPQKGRFRQQAEYIVWGSNGPMPINRPVSCLPGVFRYGNPQNRIHVTEKPLQLMKDVIQICEPGGLILDPFAGAGTTVLAAVMTGYRAVGIEVTDAYYKLGSDRVKIALEAEQKEDEK